jgi:protein involved in polysaccharide export with SLBB domain
MLTHMYVRQTGFLVVLIAGIGWAGTAFAADGEGRDKSRVAEADIPRELAMRPLPTYRIEPPDILQIDVTCAKAAQSEQSQPPKKAEGQTPAGRIGNESGGVSLNKTGEGSIVVDKGTLTIGNTVSPNNFDTNINTGTLTISGSDLYSGTTFVTGNGTSSGLVTVTSGNTSSLNTNPNTTVAFSNAVPSTGVVKVSGAIRGHIGTDLGTGQYLVGPDGTINMRQYGEIQVMGMTVAELKAVLEKHLSKYMESPVVCVNVLGFNSKVFYVITDGAGYGDNVRRIPITGNETVLDAVASVGGLSQLSSKRMWISRPSPMNPKKGTILKIDYEAITRRGATETNYQIMPGDRFFIAGDGVVAFNNNLGKTTAPVERVMGMISLGASTIRSVKQLLKDNDGPQETTHEDW